jgi:chemotaxis protein methyltransferase CheR
MNEHNSNMFWRKPMSTRDFNRVASFMLTNYGIKLPLSKKTMLEGRLQKRLGILKMSSFAAYCDYVFSPEGQSVELVHMVDIVTTNKTDFFRESAHFDFLAQEVIAANYRSYSSARPFKVWSAACSTGEEPYTIAMVLSELRTQFPAFDYSILGTDISTRVLQMAQTAIYTEEKAMPISLPLKKKYLLKSKDAANKTVRIVPELRSKVETRWLNLIKSDMQSYPVFNAIFCRNVLIYFDKSTQEQVIGKLCSKLDKGGHLFLGHSEFISDMKFPLKQIKATVFQKI